VFGLGSAGYFVAESGRVQLTANLTPWALTVMLLAIVVVGRLAAVRARRPRPEQLLVLAAAGLALCSVAQVPAPWSQLRRLSAHPRAVAGAALHPTLVPDPRTRDFFAASAYGDRFYVKPGMPVALFVTTGHRLADAFGIVDVSPYTGTDSIHTREAVRTVVEQLRRADGNVAIVPAGRPDLFALLERWGFLGLTRAGLARHPSERQLVQLTSVETRAWTKWVDGRNLRPALLRHGRGAPVRPW
jgi:hypothetical protein